MRNIKELTRKRALRLVAERIQGPDTTTLETEIGVWLSGCLYKEIVGGNVQMFTFFDRTHTFSQVMEAFENIFFTCGLARFKPVQGGYSDKSNYIRVLTEDAIYDRKYLVPIYECLQATEHPEQIQTDKPFLYVPESKYIDFYWVLRELLIHLDRPMDVYTLKLYPPEMEPVRQLIESVADYAKLSYDIYKETDTYEINIIDPERYGFYLSTLDRPEQSARATDMLAQLEAYVKSSGPQQPELTDATTVTA